MGEIKVQVTPNKPQSLQVGTKNVKTPIQVEENPTHYYSTLAKQWAVKMDGKVQDEDYSSKYWAQDSKNQAEISQAAAETASNLVELLDNNYTNYSANLEDLSAQTTSEITELKLNSLTEIEQKRVSAIDNLNDTNINIQNEIYHAKTNAISEIETAGNDIGKAAENALQNIVKSEESAINNIQNEGASQIANIQQTGIDSKANTDLSNLSATGEKHFLNKTQITNCILEAPNGVVTYSGGSITAKAGLKVLIPNGLNPDQTLKNIEYTLPADVTSNEPNGNRTIVLSSKGAMNSILTSNIFIGRDADKPATVPSTATCLYYAEDTNLMYSTKDSTTASWEIVKLVFIGRFTKTNNAIVSLEGNSSFHAADIQDLDGKWTAKTLTLATNVAMPVGITPKEYDLSSYLPNDNNSYEVIIYGIVESGVSARSRATMGMGGSLFFSVHAYAETSVANITVGSSSRGIVVIQPDRRLITSLTSTVSEGTVSLLKVDGYRKVR